MHNVWTAAAISRESSGAILSSVDRVAGDLRFSIEVFDPSIWFGIISASVGAMTLIRYLGAREELLQQQRAFWQSILPEEIIQGAKVVCGDGKSSKIDIVRDASISEAAKIAFLKMLWPVATAFVERQCDKIKNVEESIAASMQTHGKLTLHSFATNLLTSFAKLGISRSGIRFANDLPATGDGVYLPFGGPISNNLAASHLDMTRQYRKYHIVAQRPNDTSPPKNLSDRSVVTEVRTSKGWLVTSGDLDTSLQYEIWGSNMCSNDLPSLDEPVVRPHFSSQKDELLQDALYLVVSRELFEGTPTTRWIFSALPLHDFSATAIDIFWHPRAVLGTQAEHFAEMARAAIKESNNFGFEAVLEVKRQERHGKDRSPRVFERLPRSGEITIKIKCPPRPLIKQ